MPRRFCSVLLVALTSLLGGCLSGGSAPIRYYVIDPGTMQPVALAEPPVVEIIDLRLPQYLERFGIATRAADGELHFSADHQWAESLRKNLMRVLAENLASALGTVNVATPQRRTGVRADLRLAVFIEQFEQEPGGRVALRARWQLSDARSGEPLTIMARRLSSEALAMRDYPALVSAMRDQFAALSQAIAEDIARRAGT